MGSNAFSNTPDGAAALVTIEALSSFGESGDNWNSLTLFTTPQLLALLAQKDAQIAQLEKRPTQSAYDTVVSDRDAAIVERDSAIIERNARFTEDQINAMTVDPTVGRNAAGNMQVDISFIHSTDLENFSPFALSPDWVSVVDGKITLEFPPNDDDTFFYRLGVQ